jgi:hypothetical protein
MTPNWQVNTLLAMFITSLEKKHTNKYLQGEPILTRKEDVGSSNSEIRNSLIFAQLYMHTISSSH